MIELTQISSILVLLGVLSLAQPAADPWAPVRFLAGTWEGEVDGQPGKGQSAREYRFVLNDKYLEVRNKSTYPAQPKNPKGELHEDWGMISFYRARKQLVLRQFHVEGFVNRYVADTVGDGVLRFTSESVENVPPGYRAPGPHTGTRTAPAPQHV